jgi:hypothetical protein
LLLRLLLPAAGRHNRLCMGSCYHALAMQLMVMLTLVLLLLPRACSPLVPRYGLLLRWKLLWLSLP